MTSKELVKERLYNDTEELVCILEKLGCHHINPHYGLNEIRCALPDGETVNSVSIRQTPFLPCKIFSRSKFESYRIKDIYTLVQYILGCCYAEALDWLCRELGIENDGIISSPESLAVLKDLRREKQHLKQISYGEAPHVHLDKRILLDYKPVVVSQWVAEGISPEIQKKYGIRDDVYNKRWLIPIYDETGNLISIKGRTYAPNWEKLGIQKYVYYHKIGVNDILFGMNLNSLVMKEHNEIILSEAEKSVMAADSYGYSWCSSLGTNSVTAPLFHKILKTPCANVVLAFDKDVDFDHAMYEARKLIKYKNVWIIFDKDGLLSGKESPMDKGKDVFEELYSSRIRVR